MSRPPVFLRIKWTVWLESKFFLKNFLKNNVPSNSDQYVVFEKYCVNYGSVCQYTALATELPEGSVRQGGSDKSFFEFWYWTESIKFYLNIFVSSLVNWTSALPTQLTEICIRQSWVLLKFNLYALSLKVRYNSIFQKIVIGFGCKSFNYITTGTSNFGSRII